MAILPNIEPENLLNNGCMIFPAALTSLLLPNLPPTNDITEVTAFLSNFMNFSTIYVALPSPLTSVIEYLLPLKTVSPASSNISILPLFKVVDIPFLTTSEPFLPNLEPILLTTLPNVPLAFEAAPPILLPTLETYGLAFLATFLVADASVCTLPFLPTSLIVFFITLFLASFLS